MMNTDSRTINSIRNAFFGVTFQCINILCSFIVRTIFINTLSSSYLGINGLFTNILSVLSLADLGFDTAIIYSLYKPLAEKDEKKITALMNYFKKIYNVIGIIVLIIGFAILPFLEYIINLENSISNIKLYYVLYLFNTSFTYFLANRVAIINADQKMYIVKRIYFIFSLIQTFFQCIVLLVFKSFLLYLIVQLVCTFMKNFVGAIVAKKMYPFLSDKKEKIKKEDKKEIIDNTKSFMIYKIGGVILNNTDNILISILILTEVVGIYSNYTIIISAFTTLINLIFSSALASIGNLNVNSTIKKKEEILKKLRLMSIWIYGSCSVCLMVLLNDLIGLMWGEEYVMSMIIPLASIINFLIIGFLHPFRLFRETTSAFKDIKYIYIITSILNLIFSVIFAKLMPTFELKLFGIIIATALARILTNYWLEPKMIINVVLKKSSKEYFLDNIIDVFKIVVITAVLCILGEKIVVTSWITMIFKTIITFILTNILLYIAYRKNDQIDFYFNLFRKGFFKMIGIFKKN